MAALAQVPPFHVDLWQAQNVYCERLHIISREQYLAFGEKWLRHFQKLGKLLGVAVGESLLARGSASPELEAAYPTSEFEKEGGAAADAAMINARVLPMPGMTSA